MRFKMLLQAISIAIQFDVEKDNFLFETTTIFVVVQEVNSGSFYTQDTSIQVLDRIFQTQMNFHQANLLTKSSQP